MACVNDDKKCLQNVAAVTRNGFFFTVNAKGSLPLRELYYDTLGIKYEADKSSETMYSEEWGAVRAYSMKELEDLVTSCKFSFVRPIENIVYAVSVIK